MPVAMAMTIPTASRNTARDAMSQFFFFLVMTPSAGSRGLAHEGRASIRLPGGQSSFSGRLPSRFETTVESCQHLLPALRQEAADAIDELFGRHEGPGRITGRPPYARASWGGIAAVSPAGRSAVRVASSDDAHSRYRPQ